MTLTALAFSPALSPGNGGIFALFKSKAHRAQRKQEEAELKANDPLANWDTTGLTERQIELNNARRVLRMASWGAVFYLSEWTVVGASSLCRAVGLTRALLAC